jgi:DNA-binding GntR family transcriptional regulator
MPDRPADYRRVVDDITEKIKRADLTPGERLPTYAQLAEQYGVSVSTAQAALRILRDRGLIEGHQGKGTFIANNEH